MKTAALNLALIDQATSFLKGKVRRTPMEFSPVLSDILQVPVYFKLECLQITGSFKVRGALFYLSKLSDKEKQNGVAACSAGNHGLGVAYAAKEMGIHCTIYVPKNIDRMKVEKMHSLGATIRHSSSIGYDDTLAWAKNEVIQNGQHNISAFDDERIMAANGGSVAVELFDELPDVQNLIVPVGGGGLSSGMAYYLKEKNPPIRIIGCQHKESPALKLSLERGKAVTSLPSIDTIAGGIEGGIGEKCFEILRKRIDDIALLSEQEIIDGFRWVLQHHQYLIEPTSAVGIASCLVKKLPSLKGPTVIVLTGRNVGYEMLKKVL